jgi:SAM-dependent methyltransferase
VESASIDSISLFSIFTHFYQADIERYLREMRRVLRPGGLAVTTWFVFDQTRLPRIISDKSAYPMIHELNTATRYSDDTDPLRAIAFDEALVRQMVAEAGLQIQTVDRGRWCGEPGPIFQDLVILRRSGSVPERLTVRAQQVRRYVGRRARSLIG